ncbi:MAG: hypothetical protein AB7O26_13010 [Planctomycetaceae bacterium]
MKQQIPGQISLTGLVTGCRAAARRLDFRIDRTAKSAAAGRKVVVRPKQWQAAIAAEIP